MILLGDPQSYVKYDINQPILELCTAWVADNVEQLQIKALLCTGDLVEQNENIVMNRRMVNQTSREMWEASSRAFARLDHKVPYIVSCGNHDYGYRAAENGKFEDNVGFRVNKNDAGKSVHQMMFNLQTLGGGWEGNGGDGWLRIMEFLPDGETIKVRTYSPLFGISPSTKHLAHRTEKFDLFDVILD
jgi:hypothetical protein